MWSTHTGLHTYAIGCYECYQCYPLCMRSTHAGLQCYQCYQCYPVLSDVTEYYHCYLLCMRSTHTGLHTNVTRCYRMLLSVISMLPILYVVTQACIRMLPMLPSVIGCYRVLSMLPILYVVTQACIRMLPMLPSVIGCYRVLSMLPILYAVYTHRPAYVCYQCYPGCYPFCMRSTHTGLHAYVTNVSVICIRMLPMLPRAIGCYRVLSMLPTLYVVYTHRPAHILCYQCYPVLSDVINVTHLH